MDSHLPAQNISEPGRPFLQGLFFGICHAFKWTYLPLASRTAQDVNLKSRAPDVGPAVLKPEICGLVMLVVTLLVFPPGATAAKDPPVQCSHPPCIPTVLVYAEAGCGDTQALIVEKSSQTAFLWAIQGQWRQVAQWPCSTGKCSGRKKVEGDQKTPEGVYFVTRNVDSRFLSDTYGTRALPLDYPNWLDRRAKRNGSAIWLHGTNKPLKPMDSNGCVVFSNKDIEALARRIELRRTPVIVVDALRLQPQRSAATKARKIVPIIGRWQQALMGGSYLRLKQWYAPGAAPTMAWWHRWCRLRRKSPLQPGSCASVTRNQMVLQHAEGVLAVFDFYLRHGQQEFWCGRRKMYLNVEGHRVRIVKDGYLDHGLYPKSALVKDPLFHAWRQLTAPQYTLTWHQQPGREN